MERSPGLASADGATQQGKCLRWAGILGRTSLVGGGVRMPDEEGIGCTVGEIGVFGFPTPLSTGL